MRDILKAIFVYTVAFAISYAMVFMLSEVSDIIDNPYPSVKDAILAALFIIPVMVIFDKLFITRNMKK